MKHVLLAVAILIVAALLIHAQPQRDSQPAQQTGRFQIHSLTYTVFANRTTLPATDVFRVDTATGITWRYVNVIKDGDISDHWIRIDEPR